MDSNYFSEEAQKSFAQATLDDYGQILAFAAALDTNPHRVRLGKMQQISGVPPDYNSQTFLNMHH